MGPGMGMPIVNPAQQHMAWSCLFLRDTGLEGRTSRRRARARARRRFTFTQAHTPSACAHPPSHLHVHARVPRNGRNNFFSWQITKDLVKMCA
jgi:hypothetical protein